MRGPLTLTTRISLLFAIAGAVALLIAGIVFERAANYRFRDHDQEELHGKLKLVHEILRSAGGIADTRVMDRRFQDMAFGHPGMAMLVTSAGHVLYSAGGKVVLGHLARETTKGIDMPIRWSEGKNSYRIARANFGSISPEVPDVSVAVALDITEDQIFFKNYQEFLWFGMLQVALVLGWLAWLITRKGLAPLDALSKQVSLISAHALDQTLPRDGVPRELESLVGAFNTMLCRLHEAFGRLSEFSDDIAHELRTPVNNLLLQTQVTLDGRPDLDAYRAALQANESECQRLASIISDMLFIAKADNQQRCLHTERLELSHEVRALLEFYENVASTRNITLIQVGDGVIDGDRLMIRRALSNLLSNAIRYTDGGRTIQVRIKSRRDGNVQLQVVNPGPEIPVESRLRIFERLYRVERVRPESDIEGHGLGLAIVKAIAELHGGSVTVRCADGLTTFEMLFPSVSPA